MEGEGSTLMFEFRLQESGLLFRKRLFLSTIISGYTSMQCLQIYFHVAKFLSLLNYVILSSWLQIQRSGFDSRHYQIFWEVVGLERGPLSLLSTTEELLERKSSSSGLESREYSHRDPSHAAVARLVKFAHGLIPRSLFCLFVLNYVIMKYFLVIHTTTSHCTHISSS
jgi:hypothetical protein